MRAIARTLCSTTSVTVKPAHTPNVITTQCHQQRHMRTRKQETHTCLPEQDIRIHPRPSVDHLDRRFLPCRAPSTATRKACTAPHHPSQLQTSLFLSAQPTPNTAQSSPPPPRPILDPPPTLHRTRLYDTRPTRGAIVNIEVISQCRFTNPTLTASGTYTQKGIYATSHGPIYREHRYAIVLAIHRHFAPNTLLRR